MAVLKQLPEGLIRRLRISCLLVAGFIAVPSWALDATHARFTRLLADQVEAGRVDYAALKARPGELDAYLGELAAVTRPEFDRWEKPGQLAFLINLYNAATLHLIVENYPVKSIKDIGGFFKRAGGLGSELLFLHVTVRRHDDDRDIGQVPIPLLGFSKLKSVL